MSDLEPVLEWDDIQGNILGGFNKNHQTLIGYAFDGDATKAKAFLRKLIGQITSLHEVIPFKKERYVRVLRADGSDLSMRATWTAAAFSFAGLKLLSADADGFLDREFRNGLPSSSGRLGDPPGSSASWVIGAPNHVPDLFLIVAADQDADRCAAVKKLSADASAAGIREVYNETGHDLSYYSTWAHPLESGHEHFGFKDSISQPGIRGTLPDGEYLTERSGFPDPESGADYTKPGQPLVCVGEFVLGYATQIDYFPRQPGPPVNFGPAPDAVAPAWAKNGSYLVFRRLRQDVAAFRNFASHVAMASPGLGSPKAAAMLIGRWPSGAPLIRSPDSDDTAEAAPDRINAFAYGDENTVLKLPIDDGGARCPIVAHIRKANPRDNDTDQGAASATLTHRILRRGIPYGAPLPKGATEATPGGRGLLFLSYQASIRRQFEFLASQWMNSAQNPRNPSGHNEGLGFDMVLGQNIVDRVRFAYLEVPTGEFRIDTSVLPIKDWVTATGGGYFFAPSISAIRDILAK